jgi:hypothetical protein
MGKSTSSMCHGFNSYVTNYKRVDMFNDSNAMNQEKTPLVAPPCRLFDWKDTIWVAF